MFWSCSSLVLDIKKSSPPNLEQKRAAFTPLRATRWKISFFSMFFMSFNYDNINALKTKNELNNKTFQQFLRRTTKERRQVEDRSLLLFFPWNQIYGFVRSGLWFVICGHERDLELKKQVRTVIKVHRIFFGSCFGGCLSLKVWWVLRLEFDDEISETWLGLHFSMHFFSTSSN